MSNETLFAYTELEYKTYPAYVNLSERDGKYYLTVRSKDAMNGSVIELPFKELFRLLYETEI